MKQYPLLNGKLSRIAFCIFLLAILILPRDSSFCNLLVGFYVSQAIFVALTVGMTVWFTVSSRRLLPEILHDRRMVWAGICAAVYLLPMVCKQDWQIMYFSVLICLYLGIFFTFFTDISTVSRYFIIMLSVLGVYSLLTTYVLRNLADAGLLPVQIITRYDGLTFYNFGLSFVPVWYVKNRNWGIFREPGVYQYFLMLAIYLNNYHVQWKKPRTVWVFNVILMVTMVSTFATGGVIALFLFIVVLFLDKKYYATRQGRRIALACAGVGLLAVAFIIFQHGALYHELYLMLHKFVEGGDSIVDRVGSPIANLNFFLYSPLFGVDISTVLYAIMNNTSSSTILFAVYGLLGGIFHIASWFALVWKKERSVIGNLALLAILAMTFNTQNLITNPYFWLIPMMALTIRLPEILGIFRKERKHGH